MLAIGFDLSTRRFAEHDEHGLHNPRVFYSVLLWLKVGHEVRHLEGLLLPPPVGVGDDRRNDGAAQIPAGLAPRVDGVKGDPLYKLLTGNPLLCLGY